MKSGIKNEIRELFEFTSSTAATMTATVQRQAPSIMDNSPRQIREALERSDDWADFDILELERLTDKRYLRKRAILPSVICRILYTHHDDS